MRSAVIAFLTGTLVATLFVCLPGATELDPLIDAVRQGDLAAARTALREGADPNSASVDGTRALHWAVHRDDTKAAALLIEAGADVSATNRYEVAPLSLACVNGSAAMIDILLSAGADPNTSMREGETALMTAARTGRTDAVALLLERGADVGAVEEWRGQNALMWAAAQGHAAVVALLIDHGADVHVRSIDPDDNDGDVEEDDSGAGTDTDPDADNGRERGRGFSPLLFAVRGGHLEATEVLLDAGADINDTAPDGSSALIVAVDNRNYELARRLLERGADPNADDVGWSALHVAVVAHRPHFRIVPDPLPTGTLDSFGMLDALVQHGADTNQLTTKRIRLSQAISPLFDTLGSSPFMLAAIAADVPVMRLFLDHGADTGVTTPAGSTSLMAAAGAGTYAWQSPGTEAEALEAVKVVLETGVDVNQRDEAGNTALHGAANRGANAVIDLLLEEGAELGAVNEEGWMAVTVAQGPVDTIEPFPETYDHLLALMAVADLSPPECPQCSIGFTADESIIAGSEPDNAR